MKILSMNLDIWRNRPSDDVYTNEPVYVHMRFPINERILSKTAVHGFAFHLPRNYLILADYRH